MLVIHHSQDREAFKRKQAFASLDEEDAQPRKAPKQAQRTAAPQQPRAASAAKGVVDRTSGPPKTMIKLNFSGVSMLCVHAA